MVHGYVVIGGAKSPLIGVVSIVTLPLVTAHEPPSSCGLGCGVVKAVPQSNIPKPPNP